MAGFPIAFRLAVRNEADTADEYIISSVPTDDEPYLTDVPSVDGASADLIAGTVDVGAATIKFWDEQTTITYPVDEVIFEDDFEGYATLDDLDAVWPVDAAGGYGTAEWSLLTSDGDGGGQALGLSLVNFGALDSDVRRVHTVPVENGPYTITARVWADSIDVEVQFTCITRLLHDAGTGFSGVIYDVEANEAGGAGQWLTLTDTRIAYAGHITLGLDVYSNTYFASTTRTREIRYDNVRITRPSTATVDGRIMTARLYAVRDGIARLTQLSRRARIDVSTDGGASWEPHHRGYLNRLEVDGGEWTVTVGDTTRQEQQTELFASLPALDPATLDDPLPMPQPGVGLILGGPVATDPTYGRFAGLPDFGTTRWKVEQLLTELGEQPGGSERVVRLKFVRGYLRPWYYYKTAFQQDEWEAVNHLVQPYFLWNPEAYRTPNTATVNHFGYFPDLLARLAPVGGGTTVQKMPIARPVTHEPLRWDQPKAEFDALVGNDSVMYVDWGSDAFPAVNDEFDVTLYSPVISDDNPLLIAGHPVDVVAYAAALSGIPIDATWRTNAKLAIGEGHWFEGHLTAQKFADFAKTIGGAYGFLLRVDMMTGARQFVPTRVRPGSSFTVTMADRVDATEDGSGDGQPPVWAVAEDSVVNVVTFETARYRQFVFKKDEGRSPVHMLVIGSAKVEGARGDTSAHGTRTVSYSLPGRMMQRAADGVVTPLVLATDNAAAPGYAEDAGGVIVDFAGWGVPETVVLVDAESSAALAQVGDEGTLDLPDLPVPDPETLPITARGQGMRIVRVVKRTPQVGAVEYTYAHAGELSQDAVPVPPSEGPGEPADAPVLTLAADPAAPTTTVVVTLDNAAALATVGALASVEYVIGGETEPAEGDATLGAGNIASAETPAELTIGPVPAGSTVWVRATSIDIYGTPYGAAGAWVSITLSASQDGTSGLVAPALQPFVESETGTLNVAIRHATATGIRIATSTTGPVGVADVRAATLVPFSGTATLGTGLTPTAGLRVWVAAYAYDATGNESALGTAQYVEGAVSGGTTGVTLIDDDGDYLADDNGNLLGE